MLSKCANPTCSAELIYLREGKIFMLERAPGPEASEDRNLSVIKPKPPQRVEHFWLCGSCASHLTLVYDRENGIRVVPREEPEAYVRAAAS